MSGTDPLTYTRERPGVSAFVLEDGIVYHTYSAYSRGLDGLWGMYQWLDRAPRGRNESGIWWRRHDEYDKAEANVVENITTHVFRGSLEPRFPWRLGAALRRQRGGNDRLVRVHVGDGRDDDARRLDDVDGVDAHARTDVDRRRGVVPRHVGRDDGSDDAAIPDTKSVALPPGHWPDRRDAARSGDRAGRRGGLLCVGRVRN